MTRNSVAAKVRVAKSLPPHEYCPSARCLWRTGGGWCPRHGGQVKNTTINAFRYIGPPEENNMNKYQKQNIKIAKTLEARIATWYGADDLAAAMADLLTDARHLCDIRGLSYSDLDKSAQRHYVAEATQAATGREVL